MTRKSSSRLQRERTGKAGAKLRIGKAGVVRFSTIVSNAARGPNGPAIAAALDNSLRVTKPTCPTHGELKDPVLGIVENEPKFACPWCIGGEVLEAWKREGGLS